MLCNQYLKLILLKSAVAVRIDEGENNQNGCMASFERVIAYIENHYMNISGLSQLAASVDLTPAYLCRLFRQFANETPHRCIVRHKLNRAAELLTNRTMNVKQVAAAVGYEDALHFSRTFKGRFGDSPKSFRKSIGV
jgi:AraC-like DNA-binding protein